MNTYDVPVFKKTGFNNQLYKRLQTEDILKRLNEISSGRLYLEIGGKLLSDPHAARVLPGFDHKVKIDVLKSLGVSFDIIFCMNYNDILGNRQLNNRQQEYVEASLKLYTQIQQTFNVIPKVCINNVKRDDTDNRISYEKALQEIRAYSPTIYQRYYIDNYPEDTNRILSSEGFGKDDKIEVENKLVIVTGAASNSGKMSTCLGMVYMDSQSGLNSGYSKYETFPIWNLPLEHPVNLAYEAATADIGDKNVIDTYHQQAYSATVVNYNRDIEAFRVLKKLSNLNYKSPTEMGINYAGFAITNDEVVCIAALEEIKRRKQWYKEIYNHQQTWIKACEELELDALRYIKTKNYDHRLQIV
mgnify:CR=1 FL=1